VPKAIVGLKLSSHLRLLVRFYYQRSSNGNKQNQSQKLSAINESTENWRKNWYWTKQRTAL